MTTKERPILFSGPMVRAILGGRKTQTRRIIKNAVSVPATEFRQSDYSEPLPCPYGKPGDRLWVREKSRVESVTSGDGAWYSLAYAAGGGSGVMSGEMPGKWFPKISHNIDGSMRWQPSIHMPRWASRITLEIVSVRVERLQDISEADAAVEGVDRVALLRSYMEITQGERVDVHPLTSSYAVAFSKLWESINGPESWVANPWVWVVEFRRVEQ